ncbi:hypothetical protein L7F22_035835 [Adiantum nelumboides]|nr:hypothetical protein [Adiantum nelumboides]
MAEWVKKRIKLQTLMGVVKDQLSTGRAIVSHSQLTQIDLTVLRTINHEEQAMQEEAVRSVLEIGSASRMRVAHCIQVIMERLNKTSSWVVAVKCLILIHRCLLEGGFMFRDLLSVHPAKGGHNYLNLSNFKDTSSPFTWSVSAWIRWYARFIEHWIQTARSTRSFPDNGLDFRLSSAEKLRSVSSSQLLRDTTALSDLLREVASWQADDYVVTHVLIKEGIKLVVAVTFSAYEEVKLRLYEAEKRIMALAPSEAFMFLQICETLSLDAMTFTHLFELIRDEPLQHECIALEGALLSDYDLMCLKQSFRLASCNNVLLSSQQLDVNGKFARPWRSGSWNGTNCSSGTRTKNEQRASLFFQKPPLYRRLA